MPLISHLDQALLIPGYLKLHPKRKLGFEPAHLVINEKFSGL